MLNLATRLLAQTGSVIAGVLVAVALRVLVFEPFTIPSASMEPTLLVGDYLVATKFSYGWSRYALPFDLPLFEGRLFARAPHRGDVVIFRLPRDPKVTYVKRVIGLPGDTVQLTGGAVSVNGRTLPRTWLGAAADEADPSVNVQAVKEASAPDRAYVTFDRGVAPGDDTGVYRVPEGAYFMLGDNRDNSIDSRWPSETGVGLVPAENLIGRVQLVLASWREGTSLLRPWTWATHLRPERLFRRP